MTVRSRNIEYFVLFLIKYAKNDKAQTSCESYTRVNRVIKLVRTIRVIRALRFTRVIMVVETASV